MEIVEKNLNELKLCETNPRKYNDAVDAVAKSIRSFGFLVPIVVDSDGVIVAGHVRYFAARKLLMEKVPCVVASELSADKIAAFRIIDNKCSEFSSWNYEMLNAEVKSLFEKDIGIDFADFNLAVKDFDESIAPVGDKVISYPVKNSFAVKRGDAFRVGNCIVMCGDSTDGNDVSKLLSFSATSGRKILFTSPPYADLRDYGIGCENSDILSRFVSCYSSCDVLCVNLGLVFRENAVVPYWDDYISEAKKCGLKVLAWNVWNKGVGSIGARVNMFPTAHEFVFVFGRKPLPVKEILPKQESSIYRNKKMKTQRKKDGSLLVFEGGDSSRPKKKLESVQTLPSSKNSFEQKWHPAVFPVGLPLQYISALCNSDDCVVDPFCGSGTTLLAAFEAGVSAVGMEMNPAFCSGIVNRLSAETGKLPEKIG